MQFPIQKIVIYLEWINGFLVPWKEDNLEY